MSDVSIILRIDAFDIESQSTDANITGCFSSQTHSMHHIGAHEQQYHIAASLGTSIFLINKRFIFRADYETVMKLRSSTPLAMHLYSVA